MCCDDSLREFLNVLFVVKSSVPEIRFIDPRGSHQDIKFVTMGFYLFIRKSPLKIAVYTIQI